MASPEAAQELSYGFAALLGVIQGVTEFLPVSSSGHLALAQNLGMHHTQKAAFDILLHLATVLVVIRAFWKDAVRFWREQRMVIGYLVVATIPAGLIGVLFRKPLQALREEPLIVCFALGVTAVLLTLCERVSVRERAITGLGYLDAVLIGIFQALAIVPGISRSGSTITGGVLFGLNRDDAIKFSFLLMIPVVLGAPLVQYILDPGDFAGIAVGPALIGFLAALAAGYVSLEILIRAVRTGKLQGFAIYCALLAVGGGAYFALRG